jgi:hypothetical protein
VSAPEPVEREELGRVPCPECGADLVEALRFCQETGRPWCFECETPLRFDPPGVVVPAGVDELGRPKGRLVAADGRAAEDWHPQLWRR